MYHQIPTNKPFTPLLDTIDDPSDLRNIDSADLDEVCLQLRAFLLYCVGQTGGHLGGGLGVVELCVALHYCLDTPRDHLIWDVGHQSYPHKILTGRREAMLSIRQLHGLHPFPHRDESPYDAFGTGHSSTSISAALGMCIGDKLNALPYKSVAVIGDGALTAGQAFEALNHASHVNANLLVILNDNDMSISANEGGLAKYLSEKLKNSQITNTALFEALAFNYTGPIDGHDLTVLLPALTQALNNQGPQFLHIITKKGKGYYPAENDPVGYHAISKIEPINHSVKAPKKVSFANIFGQWMLARAAIDTKLVAITPAMKEGSDLVAFAERYPERFFDVAIAEQHALTFAAGLACANIKPVVAIYSTFLQRGYDQYIHDIAIQNLPVILAIDRAGLVGQDGATHAGLYDIAALRCIPNTIIMTPSDEQELWLALNSAMHFKGPVAIRYPRGSGSGNQIEPDQKIVELGCAKVLRRGQSKMALLNFGPLLPQAKIVAEQYDLSLVDMRFVKPLDEALLIKLTEEHQHFFTLEDHAIASGAGSAVSQLLADKNVTFTHFGIPDLLIAHGSREQQLAYCGLDEQGLSSAIAQKLRDQTN
ncbi:MAG: 1-deoxy-D-xylulose-5-phosphate synthase [Oceanospirillaceae bacterium]|nr:1-deoxy-D-xylulose-5-phosphate synthase [Oceanospirillaceae bacterium]